MMARNSAERVLPALRSRAGEPPAQRGTCRPQTAPLKRLIPVRLPKRDQTGGLLWGRAGLASRRPSRWVPVVFRSASVPKGGPLQRARGRVKAVRSEVSLAMDFGERSNLLLASLSFGHLGSPQNPNDIFSVPLSLVIHATARGSPNGRPPPARRVLQRRDWHRGDGANRNRCRQ